MPTHQPYATPVSLHAAALDSKDKPLGFVATQVHSSGQKQRVSLRRAYRAYRSLNKECRRLLTFILLNLVYLVLEASYGVLASNLGEGASRETIFCFGIGALIKAFAYSLWTNTIQRIILHEHE